MNKSELIHINRFMGLKTASDLLNQYVFPNAKEITESMGALYALEKYIFRVSLATRDGETIVICVGDGKRPRTGALVAYMTRCHVVSVDPLLCEYIETIDGKTKARDEMPLIERLKSWRNKIENIVIDCSAYKNAILLLVHSHARMDDCLNAIKFARRLHVVSIPCCVHHEIQRERYGNFISYEDTGIWSSKNTVKIWRDVS